MSESSSASSVSWRARSRVPAPSASRIASSRRRARPDASSRLATLAQAMSRTQKTAPSRTCSGVRMLPTVASRYDCTSMPWLLPNSRASVWPSARISAVARSSGTSGFSRAYVVRK